MTTAKKNEQKFAFRQFSGLASQIGVQGLLEFLKRSPLAEQKPFQRNAVALRLNCPFHQERSPSFDIEINTGWCGCFGCTYKTKNLLTFLSDSMGWTYQEALAGLQQYSPSPLIGEKQGAKLQIIENFEIGERLVMEVCNDHLMQCHVFRETEAPAGHRDYTLEYLETMAPTLDWIVKERHHDPNFFTQLPVGALPPYHMLESLMKKRLELFNRVRSEQGRQLFHSDRLAAILKGVEERYANLDAVWIGAVMFFCGRGVRTIGRTRLRRPHQGSKEILTLPGPEPDYEVGCFGLMRPNTIFRAQDVKNFMVFAVEGENDAWSLMERMLRAGRTNMMAISIGGHSSSLDILPQAGVPRIYLVGDEPIHGKGNEFVYSRLQTASELDVRVFTRWNDLRQGRADIKDPDDAVNLLGFEWIEEILVNQVKTSYLKTEAWAAEETRRAVAELDDADDVREKTRLAAHFGKAVRHPAAQAEFVRRVAEILDIAPGPIRQEVLRSTNTEAEFLMRIEEQLRTDFLILSRSMDRGHPYLNAWHRKLKRPFVIPMDDGEGAAIQLSNVHGGIVQYFINTVGLPGFLGYDPSSPETTMQTPVKTLQKDLHTYLKSALQELYKGVPDIMECTHYGQGLHYLSDPTDLLAAPGKERMVTYIVNGTTVYKGVYAGDGGAVSWEELEGPKDGVYLFNVGTERPAEPWSTEIRSIADLEEGKDYDVKDAVSLLENWVSSFWRLKHQELDARYVAYHLFALAAACAFPTQNMVQFVGETHSGKSSILSLYVGIACPERRLLENSKRIENFTMASIYQVFKDTRIPMIIDEFEVGKAGSTSQKSMAVQNITEVFRNMINETGTELQRGGKDGRAISYRLESNLVLAGIDQAREVADLNRRYEIQCVRVANQRDPLAALRTEISDEVWARVHRTTTLGLLHRIVKLREAYYLVERELQRGVIAPNVPTRFLKNFYQVAAVMEVLGVDWRSFVSSCCEAQREKIAAHTGGSANQELYDRLFFSAAVVLPGSKGSKSSLNEALATEELWADINRSGSGFFFLPEQKLGIIHWITAQTGVLQGWREYVEMHYRALKDRFDRNPKALQSEDYKAHTLWPQIQRLIPGVKPQDVSVIDLREFVEEVRNRGGSAQSAPVAPPATMFTPDKPVAANAMTSALPAKGVVPDAVDNLP